MCANQKINMAKRMTLTSKFSVASLRIAGVPSSFVNSLEYPHAVTSFFRVRTFTEAKTASPTAASSRSSSVGSVGCMAVAELSSWIVRSSAADAVEDDSSRDEGSRRASLTDMQNN